MKHSLEYEEGNWMRDWTVFIIHRVKQAWYLLLCFSEERLELTHSVLWHTVLFSTISSWGKVFE